MSSEKIKFKGSNDHILAARLDTPDTEIKAYALYAHCFTCTKDVFAASRIATALNALGIAVFRFDFAGLGGSEGEFSDTNFTTNVEDIIKAAAYMRENLKAPKILIGHSLGGSAALLAAHKIPEIKAVATIGAPADVTHVTHHFKDHIEEIQTKGHADLKLVGRPFTIKKQFLDDLHAQNLDDAIRTLKKPLLILHSPIDSTVGIENAEHIYKLTKHPKSFITLNTADHLLNEHSDAAYAGRMIAAWASNYAGYKLTEIDNFKRGVPDGNVVVRSSNFGKFQQYVQMGNHFLVADEPEDLGGGNTGADPYELLLASLGACTSMTIKMYAEHKKIPLQGVEVHLKHEKIHAADCAACETKDGQISKITREIILKGESLTPEHRTRMIEIANKCPVHKTLTGEMLIETTEKID